MASIRTLLLTLFTFAACSPAQAQWRIDTRYADLASADFGDAQLGGYEYGLRVHSPAFGCFDFGADYTYTHYDYTGLPTRNRDLHRLAVPIAWTGGDELMVRIVTAPTIATSSNVFKDLFSRGGSDDFNLYGGATVERAPARGWGWRAGATYDDAFGERRAYPVVSALYRDERVELELGWPRARLDWRAGERLTLELRLAPAGGRWHVVSDERDGAEFFYVTEAWRGSAGVAWSFAPGWHAGIELGAEFDRRHDFEDDAGARIDADADTAGFFALSLRYGG